MKIGKVTGSVWATRKASCLMGQTFLVVETGNESLVAADQVGAGPGDRVLWWLFWTGRTSMSAHEMLIAVMAAFAVLGALDRIFGNRFGLGQEFENGILAMGSMGLAMIGIIALSPVLASLLRPVVVPVFRFLGADPAMFAGTLLACDMGGGPLAKELSSDPQAALLGGVITGSMMGATLVFTIPVAMGIVPAEDRPALAKGILAGIVTIPVGILVGGIVAGFPVEMVLRNLIPIVIIAVLIAAGLWKAEKAMVRGFELFGKGVVAVITIGLAAIIVEALTGFVVIKNLAPIEEGFATVGNIAIVLAGAFPLVYVLTKVLRKPLLKLGKTLGVNDVAAAGLVATLANSIATFSMVKDMDQRGKVVNTAFAVSAAFVFGDHLGFTAGFAPEMLPAVILGKLTGGIAAVAVALFLTRKEA